MSLFVSVVVPDCVRIFRDVSVCVYHCIRVVVLVHVLFVSVVVCQHVLARVNVCICVSTCANA
jgi:hypothetical protein